MRRANEAGRINFKYTNVYDTLKKLGLLSGKKLTNAAEVLFCEPFLLEFQAAVFAGTDKITFLDIRSFKGNIFSLREQAENYIKEHIKWRAEITSGPRKEIPEIPVEAIREAVGNSLCHRDYSNPKGNEVAIFKDRVEIYNPGQFPDEIEPEDFIKGRGHSILRNPLIAETMFRSEDIEKWASGIKRIYDECTAAGVKVEFKRVKTGFVVVFYRPKWEEGKGLGEGGQKGREKSREKILRLIREKSTITIEEIADALGLSVKGVEKNIKILKQQKLLRRVGPDKGGHWEISGH
jgi:ATP-dependent DNA helicase RecG